MKNLLIAIVMIIIGALGCWYYSSQNAAPAPSPSTAQADVTGTPDIANVQSFMITGSKFKFDPATISVKKGDTVKITFVNAEGLHDWVIDEFNARTKQIGEGQQETIQFVADKVGSFEYYCSVGQHRAMGMKGTLTVTE